MNDPQDSAAWQEAQKMIADHGLPPVPDHELAWLAGFLNIIRPEIRTGIRQQTGFDPANPSYRFLNGYDEYLREFLASYSTDELNGSAGERLGRQVGEILLEAGGGYRDGEIRFLAPKFFAEAGRNRKEQEALAFLLASHEELHPVVEENVKWLEPHKSALVELNKPISRERRDHLRNSPAARFIPASAFTSPEQARDELYAVYSYTEGGIELFARRGTQAAGERGVLRPSAVAAVLDRTMESMRSKPGLRPYREGLAFATAVAPLGESRLWSRPPTLAELTKPALWLERSARSGAHGQPRVLPRAGSPAARRVVPERRSRVRPWL